METVRGGNVLAAHYGRLSDVMMMQLTPIPFSFLSEYYSICVYIPFVLYTQASSESTQNLYIEASQRSNECI